MQKMLSCRNTCSLSKKKHPSPGQLLKSGQAAFPHPKGQPRKSIGKRSRFVLKKRHGSVFWCFFVGFNTELWFFNGFVWFYKLFGVFFLMGKSIQSQEFQNDVLAGGLRVLKSNHLQHPYGSPAPETRSTSIRTIIDLKNNKVLLTRCAKAITIQILAKKPKDLLSNRKKRSRTKI